MTPQIQKILTKPELALVKRLSTPHKIQDFLDTLPFNFEKRRETYMSPRRVIREKKVHCFEGALFAALALTYHGYENYLLDLKVKKSARDDQDHTLCIFKMNNHWGAISKTNHSVLRWRDPIYKSVRELAMTYFHEYFLNDGGKTLDSYSKPFDIWKILGLDWIIEEKDLDEVALKLDRSVHTSFIPQKNNRFIRKVGKTEIKGAQITEWRS